MVMRIVEKGVGNNSLLVLGEHVEHRFGELVDVPIGVDVAGRLDRRVPEKPLHGLQVPGAIEHPLTGGVAGLVHLLAPGDAVSNQSAIGDSPIILFPASSCSTRW